MVKKKQKPRNTLLAAIIKYDPGLVREKVVKPEKGKGRKDRPRQKRWDLPLEMAA